MREFDYREIEVKPPPYFYLQPKMDMNMSKDLESNAAQFLAIFGGKLDNSGILEKDKNQAFALASSTLDVSSIQDSLDFMSHEKIARMQQMFSRQNSEVHISEGYRNKSLINYAQALSSGAMSQIAKELKKNSAAFNTLDEADESAMLTAHDVDFQNGNSLGGTNIFLQGSTGYELSETTGLNSFLRNSFRSSISGMGSDLFDSVDSGLTSIQSSANEITLPDLFFDNGDVESIRIASNWKDIFSNTSSWKKWDENESVSALVDMHIKKKKFFNVVRTLSGFTKDHLYISDIHRTLNESKDYSKALEELFTSEVDNFKELVIKNVTENQKDLTNQLLTDVQLTEHRGRIERLEELYRLIELNEGEFKDTEQAEIDLALIDYEDLLDIVPELSDAREQLFEDSLVKSKEWWDRVGRYLPSSVMASYGILSETAIDIAESMELDLGESTNKQIRDVLLPDFLNYFNRTIFKPLEFVPSISMEDVVKAAPKEGLRMLNRLINKGIIDSQGKIINFDPSDLKQSFGGTQTEDALIYNLLNNAYQGPLSFDSLDNTLVEDDQRQLIRLVDPRGNSFSIKELTAAFDTSLSSEEQLEKARELYSIFTDMTISMAGSQLTENGSLKADYTENEDGSVNMTVYQNASWYEKQTTGAKASWTEVSGKPLEMKFSSAEEADSFFDFVHKVRGYLEPLITAEGLFALSDSDRLMASYDSDGSVMYCPLKLLVNNLGEYTADGIVTADSASVKYSIDYLTDVAYMKSAHWERVRKDVTRNVTVTYGKDFGGDMTRNRMKKIESTKKFEGWDERREEWEELQFDEQREEQVREAKKRNEVRVNEKYYDDKKKQQDEFLRAIIENARKQEQARQEARRKNDNQQKNNQDKKGK